MDLPLFSPLLDLFGFPRIPLLLNIDSFTGRRFVQLYEIPISIFLVHGDLSFLA
jgi:hypothetical protein